MSYAFDMSFAMAADEKEAFVLARHYVEKCMEKKNARKFIEDNTIYIPSIRYSHIEIQYVRGMVFHREDVLAGLAGNHDFFTVIRRVVENIQIIHLCPADAVLRHR